MRDYYQILRISHRASPPEIKRAYRRLAVLFHPDKNRSDQAAALFQEINEAHRILSDPILREQYDQGQFETAAPPSTAPYHRDPAYRRRYAPGYTPPPPQPSERLLMMVHLLKYLRPVALAGLIWCAILIVDYTLPSRISVEKVLPESSRVMSWKFHHVPYVLVTDKGHQFPLPFAGVEFFPVGSDAKVVTSRVLNVLIKVESPGGRYTLDRLASLYQNFLFVPIIMLALSLMALVMKNGIEFRFNLGIGILIVMFFNLIFLIISIL